MRDPADANFRYRIVILFSTMSVSVIKEKVEIFPKKMLNLHIKSGQTVGIIGGTGQKNEQLYS